MEPNVDLEKIQKRIKKLLNLAGNNPNKEEAQSAFLKAQEMLLQYKIDIHEIEGEKKIEAVQRVTTEGCNTPWARELARIFAKNFRCIHFYRGAANKLVVYFGEEDDAEIACSMFDYAVVWLNKSACNYATMMRNKHGIVKGVKQDYILGFLKGLNDKFEEQVHAKNQFALAVIVPPHVKQGYEKLKGEIGITHKSFSTSMNIHGSAEARAAGYQAGRSFGTDRVGGKK